MKHLSFVVTGIILFISALLPQSLFAGDFFQDQVLNLTSKEMTREVLQDIRINDVILKSNTEKLRLSQTKFFLAQTKKQIVNRYADGSISSYEFEDMKNELSYLTFSMNQYFANFRAFERSKNRDFQKSAFQNLKDANRNYARLKVVTRQASRNN